MIERRCTKRWILDNVGGLQGGNQASDIVGNNESIEPTP